VTYFWPGPQDIWPPPMTPLDGHDEGDEPADDDSGTT